MQLTRTVLALTFASTLPFLASCAHGTNPKQDFSDPISRWLLDNPASTSPVLPTPFFPNAGEWNCSQQPATHWCHRKAPVPQR